MKQHQRRKELMFCENCKKMQPHNVTSYETSCDECGEEKQFAPRKGK
jgi:hypothetical protein